MNGDSKRGHAGTVRHISVPGIVRRALDVVVVPPDTTVFDLVALMQKNHASAAVVPGTRADPSSEAEGYGIVTKAHLAEVLAEGMELFED